MNVRSAILGWTEAAAYITGAAAGSLVAMKLKLRKQEKANE